MAQDLNSPDVFDPDAYLAQNSVPAVLSSTATQNLSDAAAASDETPESEGDGTHSKLADQTTFSGGGGSTTGASPSMSASVTMPGAYIGQSAGVSLAPTGASTQVSPLRFAGGGAVPLEQPFTQVPGQSLVDEGRMPQAGDPGYDSGVAQPDALGNAVIDTAAGALAGPVVSAMAGDAGAVAGGEEGALKLWKPGSPRPASEFEGQGGTGNFWDNVGKYGENSDVKKQLASEFEGQGGTGNFWDNVGKYGENSDVKKPMVDDALLPPKTGTYGQGQLDEAQRVSKFIHEDPESTIAQKAAAQQRVSSLQRNLQRLYKQKYPDKMANGGVVDDVDSPGTTRGLDPSNLAPSNLAPSNLDPSTSIEFKGKRVPAPNIKNDSDIKPSGGVRGAVSNDSNVAMMFGGGEVPGFDPDAYLQQNSAPPTDDTSGFDPDRYLNDAQYGGFGQQAITAVEQGLSGATLGLSKVLETKSGLTTPEAIAGREAANPVTATASNIAGTGAMLYGTGGLGGLLEPAGAAAKIGVGVLEGATIGGVNQATDDWSQDKALDAEKIASSAGLGALLGGGGAALFEAPGAVKGAIGYFNKFADDAASGSGYVANIAKAYNIAGQNIDRLHGDLVDNLNDLYAGGKKAFNSLYKVAGEVDPSGELPKDFEGSHQQFLRGALEDEIPDVQDAKNLAQQTVDKIDNIANVKAPTAHEELQSQLEQAQNTPAIEKIQQQLKEVQQQKALIESDQNFNARNREVGDPQRLATNEEWGKIFAKEGALQDKLQKAQDVQNSTVSSLQNKIANTPNQIDFSANRTSKLSGGSGTVLNKNLSSLQNRLSSAETSLDVHNALSDFATKVDDGIKFDKIPTAAQQYDQGILQNIREAVRGDLKNPDMWGDAADQYAETSKNYSDFLNARKNFQRDFMKTRTGSTGKTIKVVDPTKVATYFKNVGNVKQSLRTDSMADFLHVALKNAKNANDFEGFQKGLTDIEKQIKSTGDIANKAEILQKIQASKKGHQAGFGTLALLEALPLPASIKAIYLGLQRYVGSGGASMVGGDLYTVLKTAQSMAEDSEKVTNKISSKAKSIFSASASQENK